MVRLALTKLLGQWELQELFHGLKSNGIKTTECLLNKNYLELERTLEEIAHKTDIEKLINLLKEYKQKNVCQIY